MRRMSALQGVLVPMLTPIMEDDSLDLEGVAGLADTLLQSPSVDGLFTIGATSEFLHLSINERISLMEVFASRERGGKIITVNIGGLPYEQMIELAELAEKLGLDAIAMSVPAEIEPRTDVVVSYFSRIAQLGIPFIVYWTPMAKNHSPSCDIVEGLMQFESFVGLKDSSRNMVEFTSIAAEFGEDVSVLQGVEMLHLASLAVGSAGIVGGGLNVYPGLFSEISQCANSGDYRKARLLQLAANRAWDQLIQKKAFRSFCKQYWKRAGVISGVRCRAEPEVVYDESELDVLEALVNI